jgi:hypothetical protein
VVLREWNWVRQLAAICRAGALLKDSRCPEWCFPTAGSGRRVSVPFKRFGGERKKHRRIRSAEFQQIFGRKVFHCFS